MVKMTIECSAVHTVRLDRSKKNRLKGISTNYGRPPPGLQDATARRTFPRSGRRDGLSVLKKNGGTFGVGARRPPVSLLTALISAASLAFARRTRLARDWTARRVTWPVQTWRPQTVAAATVCARAHAVRVWRALYSRTRRLSFAVAAVRLSSVCPVFFFFFFVTNGPTVFLLVVFRAQHISPSTVHPNVRAQSLRRTIKFLSDSTHGGV